MYKSSFTLRICSEQLTFKSIYQYDLQYGDLFVFKAGTSQIAVGRAIELLPNGYEAFLVPNKSQGTRFLGTITVRHEDILCGLERHDAEKQ
jgi:hypothetical protein